MGLTDSPYRSSQLLIKAKYIAYGDRHDINNPFQWEIVVLNLPGSPGYDPTRPWVMKVRVDGHLACEVYLYVDDGRITGWSAEECWKASKRFCSVLNSLGIQDAARKRTHPSRTPGPWAGTVVHTNEGVALTVTSAKWKKTRSMVEELSEMVRAGPLPRQRLLEIRGFLIYVARTYKWMNPYIKGLHLTIDGWRADRDAQGWKQKKEQEPRSVMTLHWDEEGEWYDAEGSVGGGQREDSRLCGGR